MSESVKMIPQEYNPAVPLGDLTPHPANPNEGDQGMLGVLFESNGFAGAVLAQKSTGILIDGETRWRTAQSKGMATLPVLWLDVDDDTRDRLLAEWNESTRRGRNDDSKLLALLTGLAETPRGLEGAAFDGDDLEDLVSRLTGGGPPGDDPDACPPPPVKPKTKRGDLLLLGPHRLLCGDATDPADVRRVTEGLGEVGIVYTDPPYGINAVPKDGGVSRGGYGPGKTKGTRGATRIAAHRFEPVRGDETTATAAAAFALLMAEYPDARHVWWGGNHYAASAALPDASCWLVWDKQTGGSDFADCELAWTNHPGAVRMLNHQWSGMIRASERGTERVHPTQKPVALAEWGFKVMDPDQTRTVVLDTFGGSGSTLIAADRTGRVAAVIESEAAYVDLTARRYQEQTGITPIRVTPDGTTTTITFIEGE